MVKCTFVLAALLAGCWYKVPAETKGDTKLQLENPLMDKLCAFSLTPEGAPKESVNWLTNRFQNGLARLGSYYFDIRPGRYIARATYCEGTPGRDQCHGETSLEITGPTYLSVGGDGPVPANMTHLKIPVEGDCAWPTSACIVTGSHVDRADECCSGRAYQGNTGLQCVD